MKKRTVLRPCLWLLLILCLLISTAVSAQDSVNPEIELDSHQFKPGQRIYFGNFDFTGKAPVGIKITAKSSLPVNSIHVSFTGDEQTRILCEFDHFL